VDPGEAVVRFCRDRGLPVVHGTLEQRLQPSNTVDAVVIWNTFDQLPDPRPLLRAIEQLLKPDGLLIIRIPHGICYRDAMDATNVHRWLRKPLYTGLAWNNLLTFPYLYGYGLATLDRLIGEFGLVREFGS
jgi:SAM-dependent methyltransferase